MTRKVAACRTGAVLRDVWLMMKERGLQRFPILDEGGRPVGIIYARDTHNLPGEVGEKEALLREP